MRGAAFVAHAIPNGSFAGAAGAGLVGVSTLWGLGLFSVGGALGIAMLSRRGRRDVATALSLVFMLGLGSLFLSLSGAYASSVFSLLFGEILGIGSQQLLPTAALSLGCLLLLAILWRPLLLASVLPEVADGSSSLMLELAFLLVVALATTMTVPVVGTTLIFSLLVAPAAIARTLSSRPGVAMALSITVALIIIWASIALAFISNWPVGFFVGVIGAIGYVAASFVAPLVLRAPSLVGRAG